MRSIPAEVAPQTRLSGALINETTEKSTQYTNTHWKESLANN